MPIRRTLLRSADRLIFCAYITLDTSLRVSRGCFVSIPELYTSHGFGGVIRPDQPAPRLRLPCEAQLSELTPCGVPFRSSPIEERYHPISKWYAQFDGPGLRICEPWPASFAHCEIRIQTPSGTPSVAGSLVDSAHALAGASPIAKGLHVPVASGLAPPLLTRSVSVRLVSHAYGKAATLHVMRIVDTRDGGTVPGNAQRRAGSAHIDPPPRSA
jgi:hypothetical protein